MTEEKAHLILLEIEIITAHKKAVNALAEALDEALENCEAVRKANVFHVLYEKDLRELAAVLGKEVETPKDRETEIGFWHGEIWIFSLIEREEE